MIALVVAFALSVVVDEQVEPARAPDRSWQGTIAKPVVAGRLNTGTEPVENLPHANGRSFATLDAYLAHLRDHAAPIDKPWYREVRPGVYRRETGNLRNGAIPREFTRAELERRFGFAH
jgi:hypothetical protein